MRKILFAILLIVTLVFAYQVIVKGFTIGDTTIKSYKDIEDLNKKLTSEIADLEKKNSSDFETKKSELLKAVKNYNEKKEQYQALNIVQVETEPEFSTVDLYDIDFLWTIIGNYATQENISLQFDVSRSTTSSASSQDYMMCDLSFNISGDYIKLTDFLYDLEDDDRLGFEIKDFSMKKGGSDLQVTFKAREVPINSTNLSTLTSSTSSSDSYDSTGYSSTTNTAKNNTVKNTASNTSTNTAKNTVTNQVANITVKEN